MKKRMIIIISSIVGIVLIAALVSGHFIYKNNKRVIPDPNGTIPISTASGLYDADGNQTKTWDDLVTTVSEETAPLIVVNENTIVDCDREMSGKLVIPEGITVIGKDAFLSCQKLTSITLPDSVVTLELDAFYNCIALEEVVVSATSQLKMIGYGAFTYCHKLKSFNVPSTVTTIAKSAFLGCTALESITWPASIQVIGNSTFKDCESLASIVFNGSITKIDDYAFYNCASMTEFTIQNTVTEIGEFAFWGCDSLKEIEIPDTVTVIEKEAFNNCLGLTKVTFLGEDDLTLGTGLFEECRKLKEVILPKKLSKITDHMFYGCDSLETLIIPEYVIKIGMRAFCFCDSLNITFAARGNWIYSEDDTFTEFTHVSFSKAENRAKLVDGLENCYFKILEENFQKISVSLTGEKVRRTFSVGEQYDNVDVIVSIVNDQETSTQVFLDDCEFVVKDQSNNLVTIFEKAGIYTVGVSYNINHQTFEESYDIVVEGIVVDSSSVKKNYVATEALDLTNLQVNSYTFEEGVAVEHTDVSEYTYQLMLGSRVIEGTTLPEAGVYTVIISYTMGLHTYNSNFEISVEAVQNVSLKLNTDLVKKDYLVGDSLDTANLEIAIVNNLNAETAVSVADCIIEIHNSEDAVVSELTTAGTYVVIVQNGDFQASYEITVTQATEITE